MEPSVGASLIDSVFLNITTPPKSKSPGLVQLNSTLASPAEPLMFETSSGGALSTVIVVFALSEIFCAFVLVNDDTFPVTA